MKFEEEELSGGTLYRHYVKIMETKIGRKLKKGECIHHIDGNRNNNNSNNLMLFKSKKDHNNFHRIQRENQDFPYLWKGRNKKYKEEWYSRNKERILKKQALKVKIGNFSCKCGRSFTTASGLGNHRRSNKCLF